MKDAVEMKITNFELVLIASILLVVSMFMMIREYVIGIIAFAILYYTFMRLRRQKCTWLKEHVVIGE